MRLCAYAKKQFQKVDIFSRESEIEEDEFHETENLWENYKEHI